MELPKQSSYPKELIVGTETYKVRFCKRILGDHCYYGLTDSGSKVIKIKKGLTEYETFITFIHEVLHAFEFEYNLKIKHELIYQLEKVIAQFFFQNF